MKLQNSLEMTLIYGFAVVIIAVVIIALVSLGVFQTPVTTTCNAQVGFKCQNLVYSNSTGNVIATITEDQGSWASENIIIMAQGGGSGGASPALFVPGKEFVAGAVSLNQPMAAEMPMLDVSGNVIGRVPLGFTEDAEIWVQYTLPGSRQYLYVLVAKVVAKAT